MSRRKLGIHVRKGYSRKKFCSDHGSDDTTELIVKVPISAYCNGALDDTNLLYNRLHHSGMLPKEWNLTLVSSTTSVVPFLALYKLHVTPPLFCVDYSYMLSVAPDGSWTLCVGRTLINQEHCQLLMEAPTKLSSLSNVLSIISSVEGSKYCIGNADEKFRDISDHHGGVFKDQSGKKITKHHVPYLEI